MSGTGLGQDTDALREARESVIDGNSPLDTEQRSVVKISGSLYINVTDYGRRTHSIEKGDDLQVETYADRIVIRTEGDLDGGQ